MKDMTYVRNKPIPGLVVRSGFLDRTVTVAIQRLVKPHSLYRRYSGKKIVETKLMVHDKGISNFFVFVFKLPIR